MKTLARWFFLWTHHDEYIEVTKFIRSHMKSDSIYSKNNALGAIEVLEVFNMLKD